jgi:hypothetical protein
MSKARMLRLVPLALQVYVSGPDHAGCGVPPPSDLCGAHQQLIQAGLNHPSTAPHKISGPLMSNSSQPVM